MQGFRQILMGPAHPPYERFIVAPGHQMGFNDLKIIEARELLKRIEGEPSLAIDFEAGLAIERTIHAIARSSREGRWVAMDEASTGRRSRVRTFPQVASSYAPGDGFGPSTSACTKLPAANDHEN